MGEKGMVFGRINIIDATIVILLLSITVIWGGLIRKTVSLDEEYNREIVTVKARLKNLPLTTYKLIKEGDRAIDAEFGFYSFVDKIERVGSIREKMRSDRVPGGGPNVYKELDAIVWLKVKAYIGNDLVLYKFTPLAPGVAFSFRTSKYSLRIHEILEIIRSDASIAREGLNQ